LIGFTPKQVTDAISTDTEILDDDGDSIATQLALSALLAALDGFLGGDDDMSFVINEAVQEGVTDGIENGNVTDTLVGKGAMLIATVGSGNNPAVPTDTGGFGFFETVATTTFVAPYTGQYKLDVIMDQNRSGANGGRGPDWSEIEDAIAVGYILSDITGGGSTEIASETSGGLGAFGWTDFAMTTVVSLTAGRTYRLLFDASGYTESNLGETIDITYGWAVYTAS
jgi:hypothetical protein